ncbi:MAG TPA: molybdopterin cofactor-binding domain-containing protein [Paludibaculum sp.]|jgi:isoquinoline 1-oxidoreductase
MPDLSQPTRRHALQSLGLGLFIYAGTPLRIESEPNGVIAVYTGKVELGQGSTTLLAQAVAEELRIPVSKIRMVMGDTETCPDDGGTWASLTTPLTVPALRAAAAQKRGGPLTPPAEWKVLGHHTPDTRGPAIVTGAQLYPSDLRVEGMLHASIIRSPAYNAKLLEAFGAHLLRDGDLIAAIAPDPLTAAHAAARIQATWESKPFVPNPANHQALAAYFKSNSTPPVQQVAKYPPLTRRGDVEKALAEGENKHTSRYWLPYIAHVPLEPRAAIAIWKNGAVEILSGCQAPFAVRAQVARALAIPESKVRIRVTGPGGAFGGKQNGEVEIEAARLARAANATVRVAWTREEEFTAAYHRPAGVVEIESARDSKGRLTAWRHRNYNSGAPALPTPYDTPNISCEFHRSPSPVRQGSYRSLAAVANIFARESHIDEVAAQAHIDPREFRLNNLADPRMKRVIAQLARTPGGFACTIEKDARIALVAQVAIAGKTIRVTRLSYAGDYGAVLNPGNLRNQIMGALVQGLGGALTEEVQFDAQSQTTRALTTYEVPRFSHTPEIDIRLIDRREIEAAGAGEAAITLVAPAIASAIFQSTGRRLRDLPLRL